MFLWLNLEQTCTNSIRLKDQMIHPRIKYLNKNNQILKALGYRSLKYYFMMSLNEGRLKESIVF